MTNFTPTVGSVPAQPTQPIPYKLVPMDRDLIPQIAALEQRCFSVPWTREQLESQLLPFVVVGCLLEFLPVLAVICDHRSIDQVPHEEAVKVEGLERAHPF